MIRIAIATLGCKTNQFESAAILDQFETAERMIVDWDEPADIYIINTCTVTNRTDYKGRYLIRQALARKALNPLAKVVVTGCFAQRSFDEIMSLGAIDLIVDNQHKLDIADILAGHEYHFQDIMTARDFHFKPVSRMHDRTRAFHKIQDGCDFYCAYCAVPYARGHNRSASLAQVLAQAELLVNAGYKETVLGGVNLGLYRDGEHTLLDVVRAMAEITGLELIRLSSLEPQLITDELISGLKGIPKFCPHLHIALQSGCNTVLQRMGRHYATEDVSRLVSKLLSAFPDLAIGFDVITGFPGETDQEHQATLDFLDSLPFTYLHVFSYSKRKGTPAATMPDQVLSAVKTLRSQQLHALSLVKTEAYRKLLLELNPSLRGVVEAHHESQSEFLSDHYLRVRAPGTQPIGSLLVVPANAVHFEKLSIVSE